MMNFLDHVNLTDGMVGGCLTPQGPAKSECVVVVVCALAAVWELAVYTVAAVPLAGSVVGVHRPPHHLG